MSQVKVAILGCGGMSGAHANRFKSNPDVQIVGLCDVSQDIVSGYIERHLADYAPAPQAFTDAEEMYVKTKPDAVAIITPHTLHFEHGMQALEHGCHVLMEKPMVTSAGQAHELAAKVEQAGKILTVGYNTPCTPEFAFLREQIRGNTYGKLELVSGWLVQNWLAPTTGTWRQKPELSGGGQAYDSGAHLLNSLCWTVESPVDTVFAFIDNMTAKVDINSSINIRFKNGVFASIIIGGNCPPGAGNLMYAFDNGRVDIDGWGGSWIKVYQGAGEVKYPQITGAVQTPNDNFIDAILGRAEPRTSAQNGIIQSELMDAIYESARTGQPASPK